MEDIKKLKNILLNYIYNDKVLLEIELNKVSDKMLVIGLLVEILGKLEDYEADKDIIQSTLLLFVDDEYMDKFPECHSHFRSCYISHKNVVGKIPYNDNGVSGSSSSGSLQKSLDLLNILKNSAINGIVNPMDVPDFVKGIKECSPDNISLLKGFLLNSEMYELVVDIDKILA